MGQQFAFQRTVLTVTKKLVLLKAVFFVSLCIAQFECDSFNTMYVLCKMAPKPYPDTHGAVSPPRGEVALQ